MYQILHPPPHIVRNGPVFLKRLMPITLAAIIAFGLPNMGAAQNCTEPPAVEIGFKKRTITVLEGQTAQVEITATFKGDHSEAVAAQINYSFDPHAYYQKGQFNEAMIIGGTADTSDFEAVGGVLDFGNGQTSRIINVAARDDNEDEDNEKFYANLSIDTNVPADADPENLEGGHRTKEQVCANPVISFRPYGYFATINIRDKSLSSHWLYGNN